MGLGNMFSDADFSGLLESKEPLVVSKVIQKAFIEVNEEGAEAAAATGKFKLYIILMHGFLYQFSLLASLTNIFFKQLQ